MFLRDSIKRVVALDHVIFILSSSCEGGGEAKQGEPVFPATHQTTVDPVTIHFNLQFTRLNIFTFQRAREN